MFTRICLLSACGLVLSLPAFANASNLTLADVPQSGIGQYTFERARALTNATTYSTTNTNVYGVPFDPHAGLPAGVTALSPRGQIEGEDGWGVALVYQLVNGVLAGDGSINPKTGGTYYDNSAGLNNVWLVAVFHGGVDRSVTLRSPSAGHLSDFDVVTTGTQMELWAVPKDSLSSVADPSLLVDYAAGNRTAANQYTGWLDATSMAAGIRLFTATSQYELFKGGLSANGKFDGTMNMYFDVNPESGAWASIADSDHYLTPTIGGNGDRHFSDIFMTFTDQYSDTWNALGSDQGGWDMKTPEPATLAMLALGALALLRRRK
jgi:hypothetical protein